MEDKKTKAELQEELAKLRQEVSRLKAIEAECLELKQGPVEPSPLELDRSLEQVQISSEVARLVATTTELDDLYRRIVTLIKERLGYYHVQLLRLDSAVNEVVLAAGYGEVGAQLLAEDYRLSVSEGLIGLAAATGLSVLGADVSEEPRWQPTPHLPDTNGELSVPIKLGQEDVKAQVSGLEYFINDGFDGFVVTAIDPDIIAPAAKKALNQGMAVVAHTTDLGTDNQSALVWAIEHELGYSLGMQAGEWAKTHIPPDQKLKVGVLNYRLIPQVIHREEGIIKGIKDVFGDNFEIVGNETAGDPAQGLAVAEKWLETYSDLNMIVGINDGGALGAYQAVIAAGKNKADSFFVGGIDATNEALAAIKAKGAYQATVDQAPREMGRLAVHTLVAAIVDQPYQPVNTIKCDPVNLSNLDEFLADDQAEPMTEIISDRLADMDLSQLKIGMSVINLSNPFFVQYVEGAQAEAEQLGVQLVVNDPKPVIGVLDVQSEVAGSLDIADQLLLEGLCDQIAIAFEYHQLELERKQAEAMLAKQATELETVAQVSTATSTILDTADLLQQVVDLTKERFGLYHTHIYLLNEVGDMLNLAAGAGEVGRQMVAEGWRIPLAREQSLVARAARSRQGIIINNVREAPDWLPNPLLPDTRSELAVPMIVGDQLLGVLDVQAAEVDYFTDEDARIQTILAAQIAVALQNAIRYTQRIQAEEMLASRATELEEATNFLDNIINAIEDPVFVKDEEHRWVILNDAICEVIGQPRDELIGKTDYDLSPKEEADVFWEKDQLVLDTEQTDINEEVVTWQGKRHFLSTKKSFYKDPASGKKYIVGTIRDITDRKEAEEALAKQATQLETVAQVSTAASTILEVDKLLQEVADLTKESFGLYHVHIYRFNEAGDSLVLSAGAGDVGQKMVSQGWNIPLELEQSLVARAARTRQGVIVNNVRQEPGWLPNPLLPDTHSELAVPMIVGDRVLGVLDVQADRVDHFTQNDVRIQTTLAAQIAVALQNANQYQQTQQRAAELEETTTFLDSVIENLPAMLFVKDAEALRFVRWNKAGEELLGYPREAMIGKNDYDFFPKEEADFFTAKDREVLAGGKLVDIPEEPIQTAHQGIRYLHTRKIPIYGPDGKPRYLLGISEDITERKQTEEALARERDLLQTLMDNSPDYIFFKDRESRFIRTNKAHIEQLGISDTIEAIGKSDFDFFPEEEAQRFYIEEQQIMESGEPIYDIENQVTASSGETMWVSEHKIPITDETGQVVGVLGIVREITERKQAEIELEQERNILRTLLDALPDAVYIKDVEGRFITCNARQAELSGASLPEELVGKTDIDLFPEHGAEYYADEQALIQSGQPLINKEELIGEHVGQQRWHLTTKLPIRDASGKIAGLVGIGRDITERKQAEEALRESESRNRALLEAIPDLIIRYDRDGVHLDIKEPIGFKTFLPPEELIGKTVAEVAAGKIFEMRMHYIEQALETGQLQLYEQQFPIDEGISYEEVRIVPIGPEEVFAIIRDITSRKEEEAEREELLAEVRRLAAIVENHPDFIGIGTLEGKALYVNPAGLRMMGLPPDHDVTTMNASDFYPPEDAEMLANEGMPTALEKGSWTAEANLLRIDGTSLPVEETLAINYDADRNPYSFSITMRDITERKQAETERERLLAEVQEAYRQYVRREWDKFLSEQHQGNWQYKYQREASPSAPILEVLTKIQDEVIEKGQTRVIPGAEGNGQQANPAVITPIALRGEVLGTLSLQDMDPNRQWTDDEIALVEAVSEQLALTLENLRLFDDTQQRATREQLARKITDKMRASPDVETIIQTGISELVKALGVSRTYVKLTSDVEQPASQVGDIREQLKQGVKNNWFSEILDSSQSNGSSNEDASTPTEEK